MSNEEHVTKVHEAIKSLNAQKRSTNNSQIARLTGLPSNRVKDAADQLRMRHHIQDVGKGSAHNWRIRTPPTPAEQETIERQKQLNDKFHDRRKSSGEPGLTSL